ncbi:ABC transporter ATP-binding protein [Corynebacterium anserum]|uniref:ATP-binding cassette domain-containing protein n=1 Tax=Corynebacterium anserum TaxID=2684406 RepID=A0A7G7YMA1_9CORY|nr:ATP-binding cassette domain-containing protein [Corynebacterium anserum]MBC2680978.1 ATP-binding cassette domain-containing protein [Corynebacterium anserum]QNH95621.1 ATP-binding cassette domain-containing protein [Corynebacterium anserum]
MEALHIDHLNKSYGDHHVLTDMTLSVHPGEIYGFVGSNGAGKSTTMRIALGVLSADSGEVRIGNQKMNDDLRRRIGYMPEERGLYAKERLGDQLAFFGRLHGMDKDASQKSAESLLERLGLAERRNNKLDELSLGNQQRVQLAASLIHNPDLLILDEPFSGLDPVAVNVMSELLQERSAAGVPILFSSHQLDLVQRLCDRVGIITRGHMKAEGEVQELRNRGPIRYNIATPSRGWYPTWARIISETDSVILEVDSEDRDQELLHAALAAGPVHSFTRRIPDLTELFQEVVQS